jgi:transcriptional regulator GlxA family with amidase domain
MQIATFADRIAEPWLRECRRRGVVLASLCNGTHILARAGLLNERRCAIHWENYPGFAEQFQTSSVSMGLYEVDGNIHTSAGGTASVDMMLDIVRRDHGDTIVNQVCERALIDRVRQPSDRQRRPFAVRMGRLNPTVARVIEAMEDNLSEPLVMDQLADVMMLSRRQIERLFRNEIGSSPVRYYRKLRLDRARLLLIQTAMPIVEVVAASGFVSASHFSKCFREVYGCTPQDLRTFNAVADARGTGIPKMRDMPRTDVPIIKAA